VVRGGTTTVEFGPDATQVDVLAAAAGAEHTDTREQKAVTESAPTVDPASTDGSGTDRIEDGR
jgi:rhamnose transport system ATP-binding protein